MSTSKYALVERERRFLVPCLPSDKPTAVWSIVDRYLDASRIRLRMTTGMVGGRSEVVRKLTQKLPQPNGVV